MCGRYALFSNPDLKEIRKILEEVQNRNETVKTGEIFPTNKAPVLVQERGAVMPEAVEWGFPHFHNKGVIINARAETVQERPMFRKCLPNQRCVIPSTGFFEWSHDANKVKYQFNLPGTDILYMAGLYDEFHGERRFVILTTAANFSMRDVHDRMPVVLDANGRKQWLQDAQGAVELLNRVPPELIKVPV